MHLESYSFQKDDTIYRHRYAFISSDQKKIIKIVEFDAVEMPLNGLVVYNLSFGDLNNETLDISYDEKSRNGDVINILTTIAQIAFDFTEKINDCYIAFYGIDEVRKRLYRMAINQQYGELIKYFTIGGCNEGNFSDIEPLQRNKNYEYFVF